MKVFLQVPGKGLIWVGMPKELSNIVGGHPHGFQIVCSRRPGSMRSNTTNRIPVGFPLLISEPCSFTEQGDQRLIEKASTNSSSFVLKQVLSELCGLAIW